MTALKLRKATGLTQARLAHLYGVDIRTWQYREKDSRPLFKPSSVELTLLADSLNTTVDCLVEQAIKSFLAGRSE